MWDKMPPGLHRPCVIPAMSCNLGCTPWSETEPRRLSFSVTGGVVMTRTRLPVSYLSSAAILAVVSFVSIPLPNPDPDRLSRCTDVPASTSSSSNSCGQG